MAVVNQRINVVKISYKSIIFTNTHTVLVSPSCPMWQLMDIRKTHNTIKMLIASQYIQNINSYD